jgi:hypothetical protein
VSDDGGETSDIREILLTAVDTVAWFASGVVIANYLWTLCDMYASIEGHPLGIFPIPKPIFFAVGIGWLLRRHGVWLNQILAFVPLPTTSDMTRSDEISIGQKKYRRLFHVVDALAWTVIVIECGSFIAWGIAGSPPDFLPSSWSVSLMIQRAFSLPTFFCIAWLGIRQSRRGPLRLR